MNSVNPVEKTSLRGSRQWLFVFARIYLGISFFFSDHGNAVPDEAARFLKFALKNGYSWYQSLLNAVVVPHVATFATLIVVGEIYVGIALVLGLTTRLATGVALLLLLNYMCAKGAAPWGPGIDQSDIVLAIIILVSDAGRIFGIDKFFADFRSFGFCNRLHRKFKFQLSRCQPFAIYRIEIWACSSCAPPDFCSS